MSPRGGPPGGRKKGRKEKEGAGPAGAPGPAGSAGPAAAGSRNGYPMQGTAAAQAQASESPKLCGGFRFFNLWIR